MSPSISPGILFQAENWPVSYLQVRVAGTLLLADTQLRVVDMLLVGMLLPVEVENPLGGSLPVDMLLQVGLRHKRPGPLVDMGMVDIPPVDSLPVGMLLQVGLRRKRQDPLVDTGMVDILLVDMAVVGRLVVGLFEAEHRLVAPVGFDLHLRPRPVLVLRSGLLVEPW